ncbi:MAG: hypothetical protein AUJ92_16305 [Armatimonadetes bacterium CG2_30_59_28]|nr:hypothetical protein [Armatimonadota bacterium]OIO91561.1 MAG: hypothetical protein AUJ92_16305 [Armatimonadetes bacterium CG2_30_59_28]PIU64008.1 MAG: hypothetical protein COS85_14185 [Armatimonadetes bacterium CG07_land_8_20_14_0_80_59_28]PIX40735.1 MAG: hypothetical protein COZ56_13950 [Armatimonadetes bacterium CG_4_8_14_3_um_filter_58_9]PIY42998.1 MAG: hypothetical protein COZ05_12440 [Armatimonadetes bacterium CG_4_10_14_3_um_filter_59_10]
MKIGVARRVITPAQRVYLAGYGSRTEKTADAYQDLLATAICFEEAGEKCVILAADLLGFDAEMVETIKRGVQKHTGLGPEKVLLAASHTHYAPAVETKSAHLYPGIHLDVRGDIENLCIEAVIESAENMQLVELHYGTSVAAYGINRRVWNGVDSEMRPNPRGAVDPTVRVLWAVDPQDRVVAVLFSYACHPTTAGGLMSMGGDHFGCAAQLVEAAIPGATAAVLPGCFGDVRPRVVNAAGGFDAGSLEVVKAFGQELCFAVLSAMSVPEVEIAGPITAAIDAALLPFDHVPDRQALERLLADPEFSQRKWAEALLDQLNEGDLSAHLEMPVQALRIGNLNIVGLGGEVCVGYQLRIAASLSPAPAFVLGYCNAETSYIATSDMFPFKGYEVATAHFCYGNPAPLTPECEERILAKVNELLAKTR